MMSEPITLNVFVFGQCRALVGASIAAVQVLTPTTAAEVVAAVCRQYPQLAPLRGSLLVAVNEEYAAADTPVKPGDDVAVFPPIAGG